MPKIHTKLVVSQSLVPFPCIKSCAGAELYRSEQLLIVALVQALVNKMKSISSTLTLVTTKHGHLHLQVAAEQVHPLHSLGATLQQAQMYWHGTTEIQSAAEIRVCMDHLCGSARLQPG